MGTWQLFALSAAQGHYGDGADALGPLGVVGKAGIPASLLVLSSRSSGRYISACTAASVSTEPIEGVEVMACFLESHALTGWGCAVGTHEADRRRAPCDFASMRSPVDPGDREPLDRPG